MLIQGPPGTGKTNTILGLLEAAFKLDPSQQVMLCAPSNTAVDELVRRVAAMDLELHDQHGKPRRLKVVRLGNPITAHASVTAQLLDTRIADFMAGRGWVGNHGNGRMDRKRIEQPPHPRAATRHTTRFEDAASDFDDDEDDGVTRVEGGSGCRGRRHHHGHKRSVKNRILRDADVLVSTLISAGTHDIRQTRFRTVVVDEAAQCIEPELLVPLQFGATKLILIGDPRQLPATVLSSRADSAGYSRSLFERLEHPMARAGAHTLLTIQYRMNPEICMFPSLEFYGGRVVTDDRVATQAPLFCEHWVRGGDGLRAANFISNPFTLLNVTYGAESGGSHEESRSNQAEARLAVSVYAALCSSFPETCFASKVKVITPYKAQRALIRAEFLAGFGPGIEHAVEVGTVDGFQGQESDVVIFSCVRAKGRVGFLADSRRMNVALTRAKHKLVVLGHVTTLIRDRAWYRLVNNAADRNLCFPAPPIPMGVFDSHGFRRFSNAFLPPHVRPRY